MKLLIVFLLFMFCFGFFGFWVFWFFGFFAYSVSLSSSNSMFYDIPFFPGVLFLLKYELVPTQLTFLVTLAIS